ncbi:MAG: diguanylate cyclase [Hydrogenophilales bacterium]|nr:diguanylate cyclase [Hydrogenophilales bacterium]
MSSATQDKLVFTQNALSALNDIDKALAYHMQWLQELHQTLICRQTPHDDLLAEDSHLRCQFGQWFVSAEVLLREQPGFSELGERHRAMHHQARLLLRKKTTSQSIELAEYDDFMQSNLAFRNQAQQYQATLINLVCVVDHLTGAWNRYAMVSKIAEESERAQRNGQPCCLSILDLDHFKRVNDEFGHLAGDLALQAVVRFLASRIRKYDYVFRYGGEEFLLCLPNTSLADAEILLDRMRLELAAMPIDLSKGNIVRITASFGVAELLPAEHHDFSIDRADHALLCAKAKGRNRVCSWPLGHDKPHDLSA